MFDLTGKVALVTGAGQSVGAGIARALARQGAAVAVNDLTAERAGETVEAIRASGGRAVAAPFDVTDLGAVEAAVAAVGTSLGPVDVLVNNAGIPAGMRAVAFLDMPPEEWARYLDLNVYGVLHTARATVPGMCERGWGRVVTISSGAGSVGLPIGVSIYGAGKAGQMGFMRHLAVETARRGVTANTLALGLMQRPGGAEAGASAAMERQIPVGRLGTPADVGAAVVWLASEEASWITGQTIGLNGGSVTS